MRLGSTSDESLHLGPQNSAELRILPEEGNNVRVYDFLDPQVGFLCQMLSMQG